MPARRQKQTRYLATVVVTDIVDSTARAETLGDKRWRSLLDRHDAMVRTRLKRFGGREVKMMGDGVLATFDVPAEAISFASEIVSGAQRLGLEIRAGLHCGECEERGSDVGGIAVHIASRIAGVAAPGEIVVSSTVKDLATGSNVVFAARPSPPLKGVAEPWALFSAERRGRSKAAASTIDPSIARVLLVDDHPLWRETLRGVLAHKRVAEVVAEADNGSDAVTLTTMHRPDVVVMDIDLPSMNGIEATRAIHTACPETRVLVLSSSDDRAHVLDAVRAGAAGYLLKTARSADIVDGVRRVHGGELVFPPEVASIVLDAVRSDAPEPTAPLRVAVAVRATLDRRGLARVIQDAGFDVVAATGDLRQLEQEIDSLAPDVLAIEVNATDFDAVREFRAAHSDVGVLVLSRTPEPGSFVELLSDDSRGLGFVLKDSIADLDELADAIRRVARGESVLAPEAARRLVASPSRRPFDDLTERELEVLALMAEGRSNQAICDHIHVSAKTVEGYVSSIFSKLGLEVTPDDHRRVLAVVAFLRQH